MVSLIIMLDQLVRLCVVVNIVCTVFWSGSNVAVKWLLMVMSAINLQISQALSGVSTGTCNCDIQHL